MMEAELEEILKRHSEPEYSWSDSDRKFSASDRAKIIDDIKWLLERELAKQEAKIFAYEAIIANSNFKVAVIRQKKEEG